MQGHWNLIQSTDRGICAQVVHGRGGDVCIFSGIGDEGDLGATGTSLFRNKTAGTRMRNDSKASEVLPFCWKGSNFWLGEMRSPMEF